VWGQVWSLSNSLDWKIHGEGLVAHVIEGQKTEVVGLMVRTIAGLPLAPFTFVVWYEQGIGIVLIAVEYLLVLAEASEYDRAIHKGDGV
jgi:hypothetical protein